MRTLPVQRTLVDQVYESGVSTKAILDAVIAADPCEAERIARHHISHASETLIAGLANYPKVEAIAVASRRHRN